MPVKPGCGVVKLIHCRLLFDGAGGVIRVAAQKRLTEMASRGEIRACVFGENYPNPTTRHGVSSTVVLN